MKPLNVETITWSKIKDRVFDANPSLAEMIDKIKPSPKNPFYLARYQFGDNILREGFLQFPTQNLDTYPLDDLSDSNPIKRDLSYLAVPLGLVLNKSIEVNFETPDRVMPSKFFRKGTFFGLWELFDHRPASLKQNIWNLTVGARSLFSLARISDEVAHERLRRDLGIKLHSPKSLLEHHEVFCEIVRSTQPNWYCDILFFPKSVAQFDADNVNALKLQNYWLQTAWDQSRNCRDQMDYNVSWELFSKEVSRKHWKLRPYVTSTIKHLISISEGVFPAFVPATDDVAAPVSAIRDAYLNIYLLKKYYPTLMYPKHLDKGESGYYSFHFPTLLELAPKAKISGSVLGDLKELQRAIELFMSVTGIELEVDFYHSEHDKLSEIKHSSEITKEDKRFAQPEFEFPENSPFFRGCVKVTRKK